MENQPRSTRREFLQGQAAVDALTALDAGAGESASLEPVGAESYLVRLSRRAMACTFEVFQNAGQYDGGSAAALAALIPGAEAVEIENRDHMKAVGDRAFKEAVVAFLSRHTD